VSVGLTPPGSLLFNPIYAWLLENFNIRIAFRCSAAVVLVTGTICCWNFSVRQDATSSQLEGGGGGGGGESDYEDEDGMRSPGSPDGPHSSATVKRYCTLSDVRQRPEIVLWNIGSCLSYLGFYMPFVNLVRISCLRVHTALMLSKSLQAIQNVGVIRIITS